VSVTKVRPLLAAVAALLIAATAMAEDAKPGEESVKQLLGVMKVSRIVDNYVAQIDATVRSQMQQALSAAALSPAQQKVIDTLGVKVMALTQKQINWAQVEPQLIEAYRNTFTQREIDGMLDYYRSPAGQAELTKQPRVQQQGLQFMQQRLIVLSPQITQLEKEAIAQLRTQAEPADSGPPAPAPH
jgi:uncharacterized protein